MASNGRKHPRFGRPYGSAGKSHNVQLKLLLFPDWTSAKPVGVLSARTTHECLSAVESLAWPSLLHCEQLRFSIHRLRRVIFASEFSWPLAALLRVQGR